MSEVKRKSYADLKIDPNDVKRHSELGDGTIPLKQPQDPTLSWKTVEMGLRNLKL